MTLVLGKGCIEEEVARASPVARGIERRPVVSIVVLNWNGREDTLACIRSLGTIANKDCRLLIVDNGSTDGSVSAIRDAHPGVDLVETGRNLGYAGGNNVGIERALAAGADFVLVLNNDTSCAPDLVDRLLEGAARHPRAGMFCPRILYMHDPERVWFDGASWISRVLNFKFPGKNRLESELSEAEHETDYACGAALLVRAEVVRAIGAFDPRYFLVWEETDWCFRAREKGWGSVVVPSAKVWHRIGASFGSEASPLRTYFSRRNKLVWLFRHGTLGERLRGFFAAAGEAVPRWRLSPDTSVPGWKRLAWAARDWLASAAGRGERLEYLAKRRAFADFMRGRLGPPPSFILELNARWNTQHAQPAPAVAG